MKKIKPLVARLIFTFGVLFHVQAQTFFTNGLVAYYPFNGNANDASGNGNNGTVFGAALGIDRFGNSNSAYSFNGVSSYIEAPSNPTLLFSNQLTISAWIQMVSYPGSQFSIVSKINKDGWTGGFDFVMFKDLLGTGGDAITLEGDFSQGTDSGGGHPSGWGYAAVNRTTSWQHVVCVCSNGLQSLWVDGAVKPFAYNTAFGNIGQSSIPLRIGRRQSPNNNWFSGSIDDIRIYNRALSSNEISQVFLSETLPLVNLIQAVKPSFSHLSFGTNYQLQLSGDLLSWTNSGASFIATNTTAVYPQYFDVGDWSKLFFRLQVAP